MPKKTIEFAQNLNEHLRAGYQCMFVPTSEEARVESEILLTARSLKYNVVTWSADDGFSGPDPAKKAPKFKNPHMALEAITDEDGPFKAAGPTIFVFRDLDDFFPDPIVRRMLRSLCEGNKLVNKSFKRPLIITSPLQNIPDKIKSCMTIVDFNLPDETRLQQTLDFVRASLDATDAEKGQVSDELASQIVQCLRGLTSNEAENALSRCLVRHGGFSEEMLGTIKDEKAQIIKKSQVLTYIPEEHQARIDEIGGFDQLLAWISRRRLAYSADAQHKNIDYPKGVVLIGIPGCVADDTMISYKRGNRPGTRRLSIGEFCDKFNGDGNYPGAQWQPGLDTFLQSFDAETGKMLFNKVKGVHRKGKKRCMCITTADAGSVTLTYDHPVLTGDGTFKPAGEVEDGDALLVRGDMLPRPSDGPPAVRRPRAVVEGLKHHPNAWPKRTVDQTTGKVYEYGRTHRARLVLEARMNGLPLDDFIHVLKTDQARSETFTFIEPHLEVHHLNEDPMDDRVDNLAILHKAEHTRIHCDETRFNVEHTREAVVTRVEDVGVRDTFDVEMELPYANFVANDGVIVHNTGKSYVAAAVARLLGLPGYILDVGSVFGSLVGESERRMRDAIRQVEAQQGCVLLLDEADKAFGGATDSQGDSGVTRRVFGQLLTWLSSKEDRTFVIMTLNRTKGIPPEFLRAGRFDAVFWTDLPHDDERRQILEIHFRKRGVDPSKLGLGEPEWDEIVESTKGFVGAELEQVVKEARYISYERRQAGEPSFEEIMEAKQSIIPIGVLEQEKVSEIRDWCEDRARNVSSPPRRKRKASAGRTRSVDIGKDLN